jgi:hypothetical protein
MKKFLVGLSILSCFLFAISVAPSVFAKNGESSGSSQTEAEHSGSNDKQEGTSIKPTEILKKIEDAILHKDNLIEFRKKQAEEFKQKAKEIQTQRKECNVKISDLQKDRAAERKEVVQTYCKPPKRKVASGSAQLFIKDSSVASDSAQMKYDPKKCTEQLRDFAKETQAQVLDIRKGCFSTERQVLGLSTDIPSTY